MAKNSTPANNMLNKTERKDLFKLWVGVFTVSAAIVMGIMFGLIVAKQGSGFVKWLVSLL
jgi:hypothetical protein